MITEEQLQALPGAEIVLPGIADLAAQRPSLNASAVALASARLASAGLPPPPDVELTPAAHRLYAKLREELGDDAHSRYNAILARLASFAGALERARAG